MQVVAAAITVNIQHLARKVKPRGFFRCHRVRVELRKRHAARRARAHIERALSAGHTRRGEINQIYDEVKRHFQELVFNTVIQRNVKLSEAPSYGLPTILYDADSTGAKNRRLRCRRL